MKLTYWMWYCSDLAHVKVARVGFSVIKLENWLAMIPLPPASAAI